MKKSKKPMPNRKFSPKKGAPERALRANIGEITADHIGKSLEFSGFVEKILQTSGPTIFVVSDGTGMLSTKAFLKAGERAHPEIEEGDAVNVRVKMNEFRDVLEGEISSIKKLSKEELSKLKKKIEDLEKDRAKVEFKNFAIKSQILDKLKDRFVEAAHQIKLAIIQNRPIVVRHHNDADGYSAGYCLERAIIPLIEKQHGGGKSPWEYYTRSPCAAPFYEIDDSIRDASLSLSNEAKFSNKMPLIVIADNGSSSEDLLGILHGKTYGIDFIVVDHHFFEEDVISDQTLVHINPFLVEEDGAKFSAGMLCYELARLIYPDVNIDQIPAMAGLADRIDNPNAINAYLKIAEKKGYDEKMLMEISNVIDFISAKLRFMQAREYIEVLFGEPMSKQKKLISLLGPYIRKLEKKGIEIARKAMKVEKLGSTTFQMMFIEENFRRGFYPRPGICTGLIHDDIQKQKNLSKVVTAGVLNDAITMRATDEANFSVHELIERLNKKVPEAFVEGGGHKNAGSISFIPAQREKVLKELRDYIKSKK